MLRHLVPAALLLATIVSGATPAFGPAAPSGVDCDGVSKHCHDLAVAAHDGRPVPVEVLLDPARTSSTVVPCGGPCPDLTVDLARLLPNIRYSTETFLATDCNVEEGNTQAGTRQLMRFTTKVPNVGNGSLDIGDPVANPSYFTWGDCHDHWHFTDFSAYRLWNVTTYAEWRGVREADPEAPAEELLDDNPHLRDGMVAGHKQGFCLIDVERIYFVAPLTPSHHGGCGDQGISPGWADVYGNALDGQFIDVTDVAPGLYVLELETNPSRGIEESAYDNNAIALLVPVP